MILTINVLIVVVTAPLNVIVIFLETKMADIDEKIKTEQFFKEAFCAKKATILTDTKGFKIKAVIEIETEDGRGTFYIAHVEKI